MPKRPDSQERSGLRRRHRHQNIQRKVCRANDTTDVRVIELVVRPLLRGGIKERVDIDTVLGDLPRFRPLFVLEVKTYSCFLLLRGPGLLKGLAGLRITRLPAHNLRLGEI